MAKRRKIGDPDARVALLIDAENVSASFLDHALWGLEAIGTLSVARVYAHENSRRSWGAACRAHGVEQMTYPQMALGKNSADIYLIIDALDLVRAGEADVLAIMINGSDFCHLVHRARKEGVSSVLLHDRPITEAHRECYDWDVRLVRKEAFQAAQTLLGGRRAPDLFALCSCVATAMAGMLSESEADDMSTVKRVIWDTVSAYRGVAPRTMVLRALAKNGVKEAEKRPQMLVNWVGATEGVALNSDGDVVLLVPPESQRACLVAFWTLRHAGDTMTVTALGAKLHEKGVDYKVAGFKRLTDLLRTLECSIEGGGPARVATLPEGPMRAPKAYAQQVLRDTVTDLQREATLVDLDVALDRINSDPSRYGYGSVADMADLTPGIVRASDVPRRYALDNLGEG